MFRERRPLPAFHERDLKEILQQFNLFEKLETNELRCNLCNNIISKENFGCIYLSKDNEIGVSCSNPECLEKVSTEIENES